MRVYGTNAVAAADVYIRFVYSNEDIIPETLIQSNVATGSPFSYVAPFPKDSSGNPLAGGIGYIFHIIFKATGTSTVLSDVQLAAGGPTSYQAGPSSIVTDISVNLINGSFTVTDKTVLPVTSAAAYTRLWTITAPPNGPIPGATTTSSDVSFTKSFTQFNAPFSINCKIDTVITRTGTITLIEEYEIQKSFVFTPKSMSLVPFKTCLKAEFARFKKLLCVGFDRMPMAERTKLIRLLTLLVERDTAVEMLDYDWALSILPEIKAIQCCSSADDSVVSNFSLPDGSDPVATAWANVGSYVNGFTAGSPALKYRVTLDNELRVFGKLAIPNGLSDGSDTLISTTVLPSSSFPNKVPLIDANGAPAGYIYESAGLIYYSPIGTSVAGQLHVNFSVPLD